MRTPQGKYGCALADGTLLVCGATSMVDPVGSAAGFACVPPRARHVQGHEQRDTLSASSRTRQPSATAPTHSRFST